MDAWGLGWVFAQIVVELRLKKNAIKYLNVRLRKNNKRVKNKLVVTVLVMNRNGNIEKNRVVVSGNVMSRIVDFARNN